MALQNTIAQEELYKDIIETIIENDCKNGVKFMNAQDLSEKSPLVVQPVTHIPRIQQE